MRRVAPLQRAHAPRLVKGARSLSWTNGLGLARIDNQLSACLSCPESACLTSHIVGQPDGQTTALCPLDAVSLIAGSDRPTIGEECIGCGLCVACCPVGAIEIRHGTARVSARELARAEETTPEEFMVWMTGLEVRPLSEAACRDAAAEVLPRFASLRGRDFYMLTEKLLRSLGIGARMSNLGDTSQRADLVVTTPRGRIPVEIKSATETQTINAKAIQQAVENKLTLARIDGLEALNSLSTWVVGYEYPPDRTHHLELVEDIYEILGIRVGLLSIGALMETLFRLRRGKVTFDPEELFSLKGILCAA